MAKSVILIAERHFSPAAIKILGKAGHAVEFGDRRRFLKNLPRAEAVITGLEVKFNKPMLVRAKRLRLIASRTTQLRYVDLAEAKRRGIKIINIKGNSSVLRKIPSTAEETFALLLALVRNIPWAFNSIKQGKWERRKYGGNELAGKTIGLIGFGRLGSYVSRYARAFGMAVIAYDPYVSAEKMARSGVKKVSAERLLKTSDVVSLHCVYNDKTEGMLGRRHFRMMKPAAVFINTARGEITDEAALLEALNKKWIAGAAVDTLSNEDPRGKHLIKNSLVEYARRCENLIIVPHLGGATAEATEKTQIYIAELAAKWLRRHLKI